MRSWLHRETPSTSLHRLPLHAVFTVACSMASGLQIQTLMESGIGDMELARVQSLSGRDSIPGINDPTPPRSLHKQHSSASSSPTSTNSASLKNRPYAGSSFSSALDPFHKNSPHLNAPSHSRVSKHSVTIHHSGSHMSSDKPDAPPPPRLTTVPSKIPATVARHPVFHSDTQIFTNKHIHTTTTTTTNKHTHTTTTSSATTAPHPAPHPGAQIPTNMHIHTTTTTTTTRCSATPVATHIQMRGPHHGGEPAPSAIRCSVVLQPGMPSSRTTIPGLIIHTPSVKPPLSSTKTLAPTITKTPSGNVPLQPDNRSSSTRRVFLGASHHPSVATVTKTPSENVPVRPENRPSSSRKAFPSASDHGAPLFSNPELAIVSNGVESVHASTPTPVSTPHLSLAPFGVSTSSTESFEPATSLAASSTFVEESTSSTSVLSSEPTAASITGSTTKSHGRITAITVGAVLGGTALLLIIALLLFCFRRRRQSGYLRSHVARYPFIGVPSGGHSDSESLVKCRDGSAAFLTRNEGRGTFDRALSFRSGKHPGKFDDARYGSKTEGSGDNQSIEDLRQQMEQYFKGDEAFRLAYQYNSKPPSYYTITRPSTIH